MRFVDIAGNIIQPVSNEELVLCEKIRAAGLMLRGRLDERERELALRLVQRGVLLRRMVDENVVFACNDEQGGM